jgi:hypothetical protein
LYQVSSKSLKGFRRSCKDKVKGTDGQTDASGIALYAHIFYMRAYKK